MSELPPTLSADERRDALAGRLYGSIIGAFDLAAVYLGDRLGLYRVLAAEGPLTSAELARHAGLVERYVREWLEHGAATGLLEADGHATPDPGLRRYHLPAGHESVLLNELDLTYMAPLARQAMAAVRGLPELFEVFERGGGVPWSWYGADVRNTQGAGNRPSYHHLLGSEWLPAVPDVHARLSADPPARVADVACGAGWSSIAIARAYPKVRVDGIDLDEPAIEQARRNVAGTEVSERITFHVRDAADPALQGAFELVTIFEALHDMAQPVEALRACRGLLAPGGAPIVMDENVAEAFTAPASDVERLVYGFSLLLCLTNALAESPSVGTGAVMRPATLRAYATAAGFRDVEILPIENDSWRFYRLHP